MGQRPRLSHFLFWRCGGSLALLLLVLPACTKAPGGPESVELKVKNLQATLQLPPQRPCASVLLLSEPGRDAEVWSPLVGRLLASNIAACVCRWPSGTRTDSVMAQTQNLEELLEALPGHTLDKANIFIAGEGASAAVALRVATLSPLVQGLLMLSPVSALDETNAEDLMTKLKDCPTLILVAEQDVGAAMAADKLQKAAPIFSELRNYSGHTHGADLLATAQHASTQVVDWLKMIIQLPPQKASGK